ncbi:MAG: hypothetical protein R2909_07970 [Gemmatimonadales bacterium]
MRFPRSSVAALAVLTLACLADPVVPSEPLPAVIARDKPEVRLVHFELGRRIEADTVTLSNNGDAPLGTIAIEGIAYGASGRSGWLDARLVPAPDGALLVLTPSYRNAAGTAADTAVVTLSASGAARTATVTAVARTIPGARFEFSIDPVTFVTVLGEIGELTNELAVRNGGNDTLRVRDPRVVHARTGADWLRVTRLAGTDSVSPRFRLTARTDGLPGGLDSALVIFESAPDQIVRAHPDTALVLMRVGLPRLGASAGVVSLTGIRGGEQVRPETVVLSNVGEGSFASLGRLTQAAPAYRTGEPRDWLTTRLDGATLTLTADPSGLAEGTYHASVETTSEHGGTLTVATELEVRLPGLTLNPTAVGFNAVEGGASPGVELVGISNSGSGTLATLGALSVGAPTHAAGEPGGWLAATLADSTVTLRATTGTLRAGTYHATVPVTSANGGSDLIEVTFALARPNDPPVMSLSTTQLDFAATRGDPDPAPSRVKVSNTGGGSLGALSLGPVTSIGDWLSASIAGDEVVVVARVGTLGKGTWTGTIEVRSEHGGNRSIVATLTVGVPVLTLSSTAASFSATQGGSASPTATTVVASNTGSGSYQSLGGVALGAVVYGAGQPTGWLSATRVDSMISLAAASAALPPGLYSATVPVASGNGGSTAIDVRLTVTTPAAQPALALASRAVGLAAAAGSATPVSEAVAYYNSGGGTDADLGPISAPLPGGAPWLSRTIGSGQITFRADPTGLAAGSYMATVTVSASPGGSVPVAVTLSVAATDQPPALALSSRSVSFASTEGAGANPSAQTVSLLNVGGGGVPALGTLARGPIGYGPGASGWLTTASLSGATGVLTLRPETGALGAGTYQATVPLTANAATSGSPDQVTVRFTVAPANGGGPATLALEATTASFSATAGGANPSTQSIDLYNSGAGGLGALDPLALGTVSYGAGASGWLSTASLNPTNGRITLGVSVGGLAAGTYDAVLPVTANGAGSPQAIDVTLTVAPASIAPELTLSTSRVGFAAQAGGGNPGGRSIQISNTGGGSLGALSLGAVSYSPGSPSGWLGRSLAGSTLSLSAQTGSLAAGSYSASFTVSAGATGVIGSPATVTVDFTVSPSPAPPVLTLSSRAQSFATRVGSNPAGQSVNAINTGGGDLSSLGTLTVGAIGYGAGATGWLSVTIAQATKIVTLTPAAGGLAAGSYTASVPINSPTGGSETIAVTLSVAAQNAPPRLEVSAPSLTFQAIRGSADPDPQIVTVSNAGGGTLQGVGVQSVSYGASATGWLSHVFDDPEVTFGVAAGGLPAGIHTANATIGSANGGSRSIAVSLEVKAPILTLSATALSFGTSQDDVDPPSPQTVTASNSGVGTTASLGALSLGPVSYPVGEPSGWLRTSLAGTTVTVSTATDGLPSGTFTASAPVSSEFGGSATIVATLTVAPGAAPPVLALSATSVDLAAIRGGADPAPQSITISNAGGQTLGEVRALAPPDAPWLDATVQGRQAVFSATSQGLDAGDYLATVVIATEHAGSRDVQVRLAVGAPVLALSSRLVTFGDTVGSPRTLRSDVFVTNSGVGDWAALGVLSVGTIRYGAGEPSGWLIEPTSDEVVPGAAVTLSARVGALPEGSYQALVPVRSTAGGEDTIVVRVAANRPDPALDRPAIEIASNDTAVTAITATRAAGDTAQFALRLAVRNPSNTAIALTGLRIGTPTYRVGSGGWIVGAYLDKTSAPFESPAELLVAIAPGGLVAGRYEADLPISSSVAKNSPVTLRIVLLIQ